MPYKVIGGKATQVKYSSDEVFSRIKHEDIKFIDLQFTGLTGRFHHTTISADTFTPDQMEDGLPKLDGSSIVGFTDIADSDLILNQTQVHLQLFHGLKRKKLPDYFVRFIGAVEEDVLKVILEEFARKLKNMLQHKDLIIVHGVLK